MRGIITIVLAALAGVFVLMLFLHAGADSWLVKTIAAYQPLFGSTVAVIAAAIAYVNISRQFDQQRQQDRDRRVFERQQLARALAAEAQGIVDLFDARNMPAYYGLYAARIRAAQQAGQTPDLSWWSMALGADYMAIYKKAGADLGKLKGALPGQVVRFYADLAAVFDRIAAAERGVYSQGDPATAITMAETLMGEIDGVKQRGRELAQGLVASLADTTV